MRNFIAAIAGLLTSFTVFASCELGCWSFPTLWKGEPTHDYPCANGVFQYQPLYWDRGEGNNVTITVYPTAGGSISNIENANGVSITWTHAGNIWTGHPTNFQTNLFYGFAVFASGANCTVQAKAV
jgi:hypothetical protein